MSPRQTIFEPDAHVRHHWVQCRVLLPDKRIKRLSLRLTSSAQEGHAGGFEITDFRAPDHPEIDWAWIDAHLMEVWKGVEFAG